VRARVLIPLLGLCAGLTVVPGSPAGATITTTFTTSADTTIDSQAPTTRYGSAKVVYGSPESWKSYLRFPTAGIDDDVTITSATVRLYGVTTSTSRWVVHPAHRRWSEAVTYETRPAWIPAVLATSSGTATGNAWNDIAIPVSAIDKVRDTNLAVTGTITGKIGFQARENTHPPQLVLTFGGAGTTPPETGTDTSPPTTWITSAPSGRADTRKASFAFAADEPSTFECSLDGAAFAACSPPKSYTGLANGSHSFAVRAIDAAGNLDATPATRTWVVDASQATGATDPQPRGVPGDWSLKFDDEFDGTSLDTSRWIAFEGRSMNNVTTRRSNVSVADGELRLRLARDLTGAFISSAPYDGAGSNGFTLPVGGYAEARVLFPGSKNQDIYNWPAWWTSGPDWPAAGEHDVAEGLGGDLTLNYHGTKNERNYGTPCCGSWGDQFHVFGVYRKATSADVYWDGKLVKSYPTGDDGRPQALLLNIGKSGSRTPVTGDAGAVRVDYVRAWTR